MMESGSVLQLPQGFLKISSSEVVAGQNQRIFMLVCLWGWGSPLPNLDLFRRGRGRDLFRGAPKEGDLGVEASPAFAGRPGVGGGQEQVTPGSEEGVEEVEDLRDGLCVKVDQHVAAQDNVQTTRSRPLVREALQEEVVVTVLDLVAESVTPQVVRSILLIEVVPHPLGDGPERPGGIDTAFGRFKNGGIHVRGENFYRWIEAQVLRGEHGEGFGFFSSGAASGPDLEGLGA
jgi:hypothetical protein